MDNYTRAYISIICENSNSSIEYHTFDDGRKALEFSFRYYNLYETDLHIDFSKKFSLFRGFNDNYNHTSVWFTAYKDGHLAGVLSLWEESGNYKTVPTMSYIDINIDFRNLRNCKATY